MLRVIVEGALVIAITLWIAWWLGLMGVPP